MTTESAGMAGSEFAFSSADFERVRQLMAETRALDDTLSLAARYAETAKAALADFPSNSWRPALEDLADFSVRRQA